MKNLLPFFIVVGVGIAIATYMISNQQEKRKLPYINPADVNKRLVDSSLYNKGTNHKILPFNLINQYGDTITEKEVAQKIVVANFFFTTCPTICPKMNNKLYKVYDKLKTRNDIVFLSHSVWPEIDTVEVLYNYSTQFDIKNNNWFFLTGDKHQLYNLARKSYLVAPSIYDTTFDQGGKGDFIHTENIVLVDKNKYIRGMYDGLNDEEMEQLYQDILLLLEEK